MQSLNKLLKHNLNKAEQQHAQTIAALMKSSLKNQQPTFKLKKRK